MKINSLNRLLSAGIFSFVLLSGCSRRDEATVGTPANPLVVVLSPAHAPSDPSGAPAFIKKYLETVTGMSVELKIAQSAVDTITQFNSNRADAGFVTLEEYLVAREEYGVRPALQVLRGDRLAGYEGVLLTLSPGGAAGVTELAGGKVGFVGPYSVSGLTLPSIYLKKAGVKVTRDFSASHEANLQKLLKGEILAAATYARQAARYPNLKVLAVTGQVPNEPVIVRRNLDPDKRILLLAAFLTMGDTREGRSALAEIADITGFQAADEKVYQPMHDLLRAEGQTVYDLVPGSWSIYRLNQPYYPN